MPQIVLQHIARHVTWDSGRYPRPLHHGQLVTLVSGYSDDVGALFIDANARLLGAALEAGQVVEHPLSRGRCAYLVSTGGPLIVNGKTLANGDGALIHDESVLTLEAGAPTDVLLLELS